jgi:hypothetical protein
VKAKKTQHDKDWPMIRRLIEAHVTRAPARISASRCRFWLQECRSDELLRDLARRYPEAARRVRRSALRATITGDHDRAAALLEIAALASRHGLEDAWISFKRRFVDE